MLKGIKASDGIAIGVAKWIKEVEIEIIEMSFISVEDEKSRYLKAKEQGIIRLEKLKAETAEKVGSYEAEVFEAHKQLLMDTVMEKEIFQYLEKGHTTEFGYETVINKYIKMFEQMDNAYMRERALDLKDIKMNQIRILNNVEDNSPSLSEDMILVTYDLTPSETVKINKAHTLGFITEIGGETSHSAIIARTMGIPAIVGVGKTLEHIKDGDELILDGLKGEIHINPDKDLKASYQEILKTLSDEKASLESYKNQASVTLDGQVIEIACNIASVEDMPYVLESSADGIGLFRSEFLYMNRDHYPSEEEQFEAYKAVLEQMAPKPVTIRTMDVGGDKAVPYMQLEEEMNPFLGFRAIRICLEDQDMFRTQLRALLRASKYGRLRIMFPMIASLEELLEAKAILEAVSAEVPNASYELGIMIEIPAAAMIADLLAEHVDFFSIGTNDLIQYTTAVDRMNAKVSKLYSPYHPAFIRLLDRIISAGNAAGIEVGMCGNVAGKPDFIPLLLNMGLKEFSMSPDMVLKARKIVNHHQLNKEQVKEIYQLKNIEEVKAFLNI
ncbi:MAG: phosphoenolpyruvate--protein phosphotransferase [Clostridia bacterium]|nr:phosphoenolpyruvate--protein phosphotransferase [Clostridia bacterium]